MTLNIILTVGALTIRGAILPGTTDPNTNTWGFYFVRTTWPRFFIYYGTILASSLLLCPLEVVTARLSVQRHHSPVEIGAIAQEEQRGTDSEAEYASVDEDVVR